MTVDPIQNAPLTYEEAKELARHHDSAVRRSIAAREDVRPEILFFLAGDPSADVRKAIAENKATPARAYIDLARDNNEEIRTGLAQKIALLAPRLTAYEVDRVQSYAFQALEILASDQISNVRRILAETLKDVSTVPEELIKKLARDTELSVSKPVLKHSPVLMDDDLLDIISSGISSGALGAISSRSQVSYSVADAIVQTHDVSAITTLLSNESAQIREETLDQLIEESKDITQWQSPLVNRPFLSDDSVRRLAEFVAENLLETLEKRKDISSDVLAIVREEMSKRLAQTHSHDKLVSLPRLSSNEGGNMALKREFSWLFQQPSHIVAKNLHRMERLNAQVIVNALNESDYDFVIAGLSELSGINLAVSQRMVAMRSARGIVSLCWKAGIDPFTASVIQAKVAHVSAGDILRAQEDNFALSEDEMQWQLDFFNNIAV